jgi:rod shape-determining protein MreC
MVLGTIDRTPPPFFKQGVSALSKLVLFALLSVLCMVGDVRFRISEPLRSAISLVLSPFQFAIVVPKDSWRNAMSWMTSRDEAMSAAEESRLQLLRQSLNASRVEQLELENRQLRELLHLTLPSGIEGRVAQVMYDAADPFTRKVIINKGATHGVRASSPVLDAKGVLGQVTKVYPFMSEVTLVSDQEQATPIMNARTGERGVATGEGGSQGLLYLRYIAANADIEKDDLLVTSGVDGVYPAGLPVAKVLRVERRADSSFARVLCVPTAGIGAVRWLMILQPVDLPPRPDPATGEQKPS